MTSFMPERTHDREGAFAPTEPTPDWASRSAELRRAVADNHQDGASQIAVAALSGLLQLAAAFEPSPRLRDNLIALGQDLSECRPAMAPVKNLLKDWLEAVSEFSTEPASDWLEAGCRAGERLLAQAQAASDQIAREGSRLLPRGATVLTHSWSSVVVALAEVQARAFPIRWLVTRSEPGQEGLRLAERLARMGHATCLITEAQAELVMPDVTLVLTGADKRLRDDSLVNKAGTCLLARAAAANGVPFLALAERLKCSRDLDFSPEPQDPAVLGAPPTPNLSARNLSFDRTPVELVSAWLDETGLTASPTAMVPWPLFLEDRTRQPSYATRQA
jgi:ribose 1,5-bisphosphate isomerase